MPQLPQRPNLDHLKKQAKDLLSLYQSGDSAGFARLRENLPVAQKKDDTALAHLGLKLRDAQSCVAREYGFSSWTELKNYLEWKSGETEDRTATLKRWLNLVYELARPEVAVRLLAERPDVVLDDPVLACAIGDEQVVRQTIAADPEWVHLSSGPMKMPPLVAVTHSSFLRLPAFRDRLRACARLLLQAGASPNQSWIFPEDKSSLSALYGAAGKHHDPALTKLLLKAGADPNDNESLYHSLESRDLTCTRLLLEAGAKIEGTNAFFHLFDFDHLEAVQLFLAHGANPNQRSRNIAFSPLLYAIHRRQSRAVVEALLTAGANPFARTWNGRSAFWLAHQHGLPDVAELLLQVGVTEMLSIEDQFVAACARCDRKEAVRILTARPDLWSTLSEDQLRQLPGLAADGGRGDAVRLMVELGWPIGVRGGDWSATALNLAVFRGDSELARFLLEHGASWTEQHGHGNNLVGTLAWASWNGPDRDRDGEGDWLGCAEALVEHGMPGALPDPEMAQSVIVNGRRQSFSAEVTEFLLAVGRKT